MIMALLVKVFLAMFALQLAPPVLCKDQLKFKFGDLILIEIPSEGNPHLPTYIHWAVYVGKGTVEGLKDVKSDDEDIFYVFGGELSEKPVCVFDTLSELSDKPEVLNYLDKDKGGKYTPINEKDMIKEIMELHKNCVWWDPITNDCEHVLAYVRYGKKDLPKCKQD